MKSGDEKTSVWTLPNRLSLVRIVFIPAIIYLISRQEKLALLLACILFVIAGITDGLDGLIARRMSMKSRFGLYLDPIADKLLVSCVLIALSSYRTDEFGVPLWVTLIMVSREFLINGLRSFYAVGGDTLYSSFAGKLKTTLQIVGISCVLFSGSPYGTHFFQTAGLVLIYVALFFSLYSAYRYVYGVFQADAKR
ncbi:MAG TPA: CDP-diacylglycerol--glycerol-3-phosphate 3-phosphatidyltransferase [Syntrophorhabdales bacterium]|nr:CDP-diacylglycerol--glycerol-3-phosphate 3-phosphatidyltransferase [Syntrophorhabdales bacterium]